MTTNFYGKYVIQRVEIRFVIDMDYYQNEYFKTIVSLLFSYIRVLLITRSHVSIGSWKERNKGKETVYWNIILKGNTLWTRRGTEIRVGTLNQTGCPTTVCATFVSVLYQNKREHRDSNGICRPNQTTSYRLHLVWVQWIKTTRLSFGRRCVVR